MATRRLVRMAAGKLFMAGLLSLVSTAFPAQSSSPQSSSPQSSSQSATSESHRSVHHVQVPDDEAPSQPAELTQAEAAIEKQNYVAAEALLRKLLARDSSSYVAWFDLGFVENALGRVDESIVAYRKSVDAKADVFEANLNLGLELAKTGQPDAEKFLRAATQLKPTARASEGLYRAWLALGHAVEPANPDQALAAYQRAAPLQPNEAEPHLAAGQLLEKENKFADAEHEYKQALDLNAGSTDAVIGLANIYMRGRKFSDAEEYLRKLLASDLKNEAQSSAVRIQLGRVLAAEGKTDDAIVELQQGIRLVPNDEPAQRDLAELYASAGKNDLAEGVYHGLVSLHPNEADLHRRLGQALLRQRKFPEAENEFIATLKLDPALAEAYGDLAFAASEGGDYALVIHALDARVKTLPEIPITYFLRASAYDHLHDVKKAEVNYHLFLKAANGKYPDQVWQATHRLNALEPKR
jgi:Tfp pilus assembly protein PilF